MSTTPVPSEAVAGSHTSFSASLKTKHSSIVADWTASRVTVGLRVHGFGFRGLGFRDNLGSVEA